MGVALPIRAAVATLGALAMLGALTGPALAAEAEPPPPAACQPEPGPARAVAAVTDAATLRLDDGTEVRLSGILPPDDPGGRSDQEPWPPEREARAALERLALGRNIRLAPAAARPDRYGRLVAQGFVEDDGGGTWVQGALIDAGHARAHAAPGQTSCLAGLIAREWAARAGGRGLWSSAAYGVVSPYAFKRLWRLRGSYQIVEGRVAAIEEKGNGLMLRLTSRTRLTFHVHVPLGTGRRQRAGELHALLHRRVEARGWIEWRHGPTLTVADPALVVALPYDGR